MEDISHKQNRFKLQEDKIRFNIKKNNLIIRMEFENRTNYQVRWKTILYWICLSRDLSPSLWTLVLSSRWDLMAASKHFFMNVWVYMVEYSNFQSNSLKIIIYSWIERYMGWKKEKEKGFSNKDAKHIMLQNFLGKKYMQIFEIQMGVCLCVCVYWEMTEIIYFEDIMQRPNSMECWKS